MSCPFLRPTPCTRGNDAISGVNPSVKLSSTSDIAAAALAVIVLEPTMLLAPEGTISIRLPAPARDLRRYWLHRGLFLESKEVIIKVLSIIYEAVAVGFLIDALISGGRTEIITCSLLTLVGIMLIFFAWSSKRREQRT